MVRGGAGVSTYNVSPQRAGLYFNKIQCFCFEARAQLRGAAAWLACCAEPLLLGAAQEQRLLPGEKIDMPVFFYLVRSMGYASAPMHTQAHTRPK